MKLKKLIKSKKFKIFLTIAILLFLIVIINGIYNIFKPLPEGISFEGKIINVSGEDINFFYDLTYENSKGEIIYEQKIFDALFNTIDNAERYILIDMFLWTKGKDPYRDLGQELTEHLVKKKKEKPEIEIIVLSDPHNTNQESVKLSYFEELKQADILVILTDKTKLRDSNVLYSPFWRSFIRIFEGPGKGWINYGTGEISIRGALDLLNFKANHRKVFIADSGDEMNSFIISANPSGASSEHSNIGFLIKNEIYQDVYNTEKAVAKMSGFDIPEWNFDFVSKEEKNKSVQIQYLTEGKIKNNLLEEIDATEKGDKIKFAMFYFSERDIINSLLEAAERGVEIELILDPSKYGFGMEKYGIPTRPVAYELIEKSKGKIKIKFYNTHEEEFHAKLIIIIKGNQIIIFGGSANLTKRNLNDLNLEADIKIISSLEEDFAQEIIEYFERIYNNLDGNKYTVDYDYFGEPSLYRVLKYRFQEKFGTGTF